jgi:hypothetical protein
MTTSGKIALTLLALGGLGGGAYFLLRRPGSGSAPINEANGLNVVLTQAKSYGKAADENVLINTDNKLIKMRDLCLKVLTDSGIDYSGYISRFKMSHDDIPNTKVGMNKDYIEEFQRLYKMVYQILLDKRPNSATSLALIMMDATNQGKIVALDEAAQYAINNPYN